MKKPEEKRKINLLLKYSYLESMNNVEELQVDLHKVMVIVKYPEANQGVG